MDNEALSYRSEIDAISKKRHHQFEQLSTTT